MVNDKRPSAKVEMAVCGYVDPMPPIPDSWKGRIFEMLAEYEARHGTIPNDVITALRQSTDRNMAVLEAMLKEMNSEAENN